MTRWVPFHDLVAGIATIILLAGILLLLGLQQPIPQFLSHALIGALTWTFRGGVQLSNELRHRNRSNNGS